ncbi:hypothetical protein K2173_024487 [Erythroxylum novogranatense]|uniref:Fungal lipase-type domain-containing protein n=1 Tax=Erythroxylum novogranatense TaxID=1862640 RepID=A0AAV8SUK3_9ROSI|nr:hypothetical protein K2173_024487 [Erythroxylum novogranatense]
MGTDASQIEENSTHGGDEYNHQLCDNGFNYLIVRPENGGVRDLWRYMVWGDRGSGKKFLESSEEGVMDGVSDDNRWVILVSIVVRKVLAFFGKPMEDVGFVLEFILNLLSENSGLLTLLYNLIQGKVVIPKRGTETFISTIGQLDGRIDLYKPKSLAERTDDFLSAEVGNRVLLDLCIMAAKLAYENAKVVQSVVDHHWNMDFVDFYDCWNDFQKQWSTQVYILCDKRKDAKLILISFRGTEPFDADDWSTDFDYSWYEIPGVGKVHMGFLEAMGLGNRADTATFHYNLQRKLKDFNYSNGTDGAKSSSEAFERILPHMLKKTAYYAVREKLKILLREHKDAKFVVTGHSLGGALAILFPTVLVLHNEIEVMQRLLGVYTFGQPRIGNMQLGKYMETHLEYPVPKYFRVVYCNDLVPRLPYDDKTFLYKHFGVCLYYSSLYMEQKVDEEPNRNFFGLRYLIPEYLNAAWELIQSLIMGYIYGPEYKEGWFSILFRVMGLAFPGISGHCLTNYINSVRLGRLQISLTSSS